LVNLDRVVALPRSLLTRRITVLTGTRTGDVERAIHLALGMRLGCRVS
jgi:hypothetical protein